MGKYKTILLVFGTRPEAIKMCPLIIELKKCSDFKTVVCITGQHKEMLDSVLEIFHVVPDFNLQIMKENQTLFDTTSTILSGMKPILEAVHPDIVLVHGDTTSAFAAALAAFYLQIPIGHVEAGLRTYQIDSPFPEEFNRQTVDILSSLYFAPTALAKNNLIREGKTAANIYVTGNTGIDALTTTIQKDYHNDILDWAQGSRLILITAHRRENLGEPMHRMFRAISKVLDTHPDCKAVYPVHMNPQVRQVAEQEFGSKDSIRLISPLDVLDFHNFMERSYLILTDSGGIQEEAPFLGKPVLVMRNTTERPEGVETGTLKLVGTDEDSIYYNLSELLDNHDLYEKMSHASNPYGDGHASEKIVHILKER